MRKINRSDVARFLLVIALVAGAGLALGNIGRFVPTHKIEEGVYCGSCHPEQVEELNATTHLVAFTADISESMKSRSDVSVAGGGAPVTIAAAEVISKSCMMCHNYWDNFEWFGVQNFALENVERSKPDIANLEPPTDVYGRTVSPYGLASTQSYVMNVTSIRNPGTTDTKIRYHSTPLDVEPWTAGLDVYQFTDANGIRHSRLDYVWSNLSALSPGPVGYRTINATSGAGSGCGTAEKGMCHFAVGAVTSNKREFPEYPDNSPTNATLSGTGVFFQHEMAYTTAQYSAKPVKICGACHIFKLSPMRWGGEPWTSSFVEAANLNKGIITGPVSTDPFGFAPTYNNGNGEASVIGEGRAPYTPTGIADKKAFNVVFRTPDWAHQNIPCVRCHVHAGINGETVSENTGFWFNSTTGSVTNPTNLPTN